jgi:hypothetical protein
MKAERALFEKRKGNSWRGRGEQRGNGGGVNMVRVHMDEYVMMKPI